MVKHVVDAFGTESGNDRADELTVSFSVRCPVPMSKNTEFCYNHMFVTELVSIPLLITFPVNHCYLSEQTASRVKASE